MENTNELIKEIWSLWESMAECGELSIGPKFSKHYAQLKVRVEQKLDIASVSGSVCPKCGSKEVLWSCYCNECQEVM